MTTSHDRSYSLQADARDPSTGQQIRVEVRVDNEADIATAQAAVNGALAALPDGFTAEGDD